MICAPLPTCAPLPPSFQVDRNRLYSIPASLLRLPDLRTLSASHNQLVAISSDLSSLQQLEALNLHHNRMTALPDTLGERLPIIPPAPQ